METSEDGDCSCSNYFLSCSVWSTINGSVFFLDPQVRLSLQPNTITQGRGGEQVSSHICSLYASSSGKPTTRPISVDTPEFEFDSKFIPRCSQLDALRIERGVQNIFNSQRLHDYAHQIRRWSLCLSFGDGGKQSRIAGQHDDSFLVVHASSWVQCKCFVERYQISIYFLSVISFGACCHHFV